MGEAKRNPSFGYFNSAGMQPGKLRENTALMRRQRPRNWYCAV
jgi:hypothetical protein